MSVSKYLTSLGHKVQVKNGLLYDSTGKPVYKDNGRYYVKSSKGNRLYFKENGLFELENKKGFFDKVADKLDLFAAEMGEVNPNGANAFIPNLKIVELSKVANGVPVRTADGSYRTYSEKELNTAKKQLGILGAAVVAAPVIPSALKIAGLALTPSTWIDGGMKAFGYTTPNWFLNGADLAYSAHFANEAGKEIDKNGLNWKTGFNALMSTFPFTRDTKAATAVANSLRKPIQATNKLKKEIKLAREFNKSVKNTKFVNVPVEHVSNKGITEGLNSHSASDVGFHFSPVGSQTTYNILQTTNAPFVRTGTWTYTNNTKPVWVTDKGNWSYYVNPELYKGVNPGKTLSENVLALDYKNPNYSYINNFEGKGAKSYMTTLPNFVLLSKNVRARFLEEKLRTKPKNNFVSNIEILDNYLLEFKANPENFYEGRIGDSLYLIFPNSNNTFELSIPRSGIYKKFNNFDSLQKFIEKQHEEYLSTLSPLLKTVYLERPFSYKGIREGYEAGSSSLFRRDIKNQIQKDIDEFYMFPEYKERFLSKQKGSLFYPELKQSLLEVAENTHPSSFIGEYRLLGHSLESDSRYNTLGINTDLNRSEFDLENTVTHEFGHGMYRPHLVETNDPLYFIMKNNSDLTTNALDNLNPGIPMDEFTKYISDPNELRQRIIPYVKRSFEEGLTPEETYDIITDMDLKETFKKDYIVKLIGGMLGTIPIIINNDKKS